jgi:hypothetical protein
MGMYTEFHFNAELREDVPDDVLAVLDYMVNDVPEPSSLPEHPLFNCLRWRSMLRMDSYYFPADTHSTLRLDEGGERYLCVRCNLKNYDDEIRHFVDWVTPYLNVLPGDFLGFSRYEESNDPLLIHAADPTTKGMFT